MNKLKCVIYLKSGQIFKCTKYKNDISKEELSALSEKAQEYLHGVDVDIAKTIDGTTLLIDLDEIAAIEEIDE